MEEIKFTRVKSPSHNNLQVYIFNIKKKSFS